METISYKTRETDPPLGLFVQNDDTPKIDTFYLCSKFQKYVEIWRVSFWHANF